MSMRTRVLFQLTAGSLLLGGAMAARKRRTSVF